MMTAVGTEGQTAKAMMTAVGTEGHTAKA
jgi:hypothetical protein